MREAARIYPVVDCSTDGEDKVPMFFHTDRDAVSNRHRFYMEEVMPHYYRLYSRGVTSQAESNSFRIRCPHCGSVMATVNRPQDDHKLSLYTCDRCN